jgi:putative toxin-antitoxin system antitoxin component (TIGR02293 family)
MVTEEKVRVRKKPHAAGKKNVVAGGRKVARADKGRSARTTSEEVIGSATGVAMLGATDKPESQMTPLEKMEISRGGITKAALEQLKQKAGLDYDKLAKILAVARVTLINKKGKEKFSPELSEKILGLADIYSYGYKVFESEERFNQWIFRPNRALGWTSPYELMDNQYGREEVRNLIGRIDYGVYS